MRSTALILAVAVLAGCSSSSSPAPPPPLKQQPASNTGSLAFVETGGQAKLYFPASYSSSGNFMARLAVVNAAAANNTVGLLHYLDLAPSGEARAIGASGTDVVALHRDDPTIFFIDAATDTVHPPVTLPVDAQPFNLSFGNPFYAAGAAVDATARMAWVAISGGLAEYDLDLRSQTGMFAAPPTESFSIDTASGRLYAPYYPCTLNNPTDPQVCFSYARTGQPNPTDGLSIIDTGTGAITPLYDDAAANLDAPLGLEPDAIAVDFPLQLGAVAVNGPPALQLLDLKTATFDPITLSYGISRLTIGMPAPEFTVLTADPATHLLVVAQEDGNAVIFLDLAKARNGVVSYLDVQQMPLLPEGRAWLNHGDVHGACIGVVNGRPYAFLLESNSTWIARIDLQGVAEVMGGQGDFASKVAYISVPSPP